MARGGKETARGRDESIDVLRWKRVVARAEGGEAADEGGATSINVSFKEAPPPAASLPPSAAAGPASTLGEPAVEGGGEDTKTERPVEKFMILDLGEADCSKCGYHYEPKKGDPEYPIASGTQFSSLPGDWTCPLCGAEKFVLVHEAV